MIFAVNRPTGIRFLSWTWILIPSMLFSTEMAPVLYFIVATSVRLTWTGRGLNTITRSRSVCVAPVTLSSKKERCASRTWHALTAQQLLTLPSAKHARFFIWWSARCSNASNARRKVVGKTFESVDLFLMTASAVTNTSVSTAERNATSSVTWWGVVWITRCDVKSVGVPVRWGASTAKVNTMTAAQSASIASMSFLQRRSGPKTRKKELLLSKRRKSWTGFGARGRCRPREKNICVECPSLKNKRKTLNAKRRCTRWERGLPLPKRLWDSGVGMGHGLLLLSILTRLLMINQQPALRF